jgi:hypothetical protein
MLCRRIQQKLNSHDWQFERYRQDSDVMAHLDVCPRCRSLVQGEEALRSDLRLVKQAAPSSEISLSDVRQSVEAAPAARSIGHARGSHSGLRTALVFGLVGVVIIFLVFVPFTFKEKVGYEIAIAGVDKNIAQGSQDITPLLRALGMEKEQATDLVDSLGGDKVRFSVGECSETCHLRISDLKTERDVKLVVNAIIALGCCQIDKIIPIFRDESTSLLGHAVRKLNS